MFLHDLGFALLRRWYVVIFGLLATAAAVFGIVQVVPVTYQASASSVLVPPQTAVIDGENPYLYMGALDQALSVLVVKMNSAEVMDPILEKNVDLSYALTKDVATTGPIILIEADAPTAQAALSIVDQVLEKIPPNLAQIQDALGVPKDARITVMTIVQAREAEEITKKQQRMMIAGSAAGLAMTVLITGLLDKLMTRHRRKKIAKRLAKKTQAEHRSSDEEEMLAKIDQSSDPGDPGIAADTPIKDESAQKNNAGGGDRLAQSSLIDS